MRGSTSVAIQTLFVFLSTQLLGCALLAEYPITSASVGVWGTTGKGPADHVVSYAFDEDCETLRAINAEQICKKTDTANPEVVDKSFNVASSRNQYGVESHQTTPYRSKNLPHRSSGVVPSKKQVKSAVKKRKTLKK